MNIVRATIEHTDITAPLFDLYRQFYKAEANLESSRQFIFDRLSKNESVIFLAMDNDKAIGFAQLYALFALIALKSLWLLNDLYVDSSARKAGVGEALIHKAEDFARETNARGLFLRTATDNIPAQKLYEKCGWVRDEQFYRYDLIFK